MASGSIDAQAQVFVPQTALAYMRGKKVDRVSWNWRDTWQEEHLKSFVVAKMARADLLNEVHKSLETAIASGQTYEDWRKGILPKLQGEWIGRTVGDLWDELPDEEKAKREPPSERQREQIISPRRLETIWRTNMLTSYAAGRYKAQIDAAEAFPFWRYITMEDGRVRKAHAALHGKVFRFDDPIWKTHYPPNGWGCRCEVEALDEEDLDHYGYKVSSSDGHMVTKQDSYGKDVAGYRDDAGHITYTSDGWSYNPADGVAEEASQKAKDMPPELGKQLDEAARKAAEEEAARKTAAEEAARKAAEEEAARKAAEEEATRKAVADEATRKAAIPEFVRPFVDDAGYFNIQGFRQAIKNKTVEHAAIIDSMGRFIAYAIGGKIEADLTPNIAEFLSRDKNFKGIIWLPKSEAKKRYGEDYALTDEALEYAMEILKGGTLIHNHPEPDSPLSNTDIETAIKLDLKRVEAICINGREYVLEFERPLSPEEKKTCYNCIMNAYKTAEGLWGIDHYLHCRRLFMKMRELEKIELNYYCRGGN